jgi:hypothetical protein
LGGSLPGGAIISSSSSVGNLSGVVQVLAAIKQKKKTWEINDKGTV